MAAFFASVLSLAPMPASTHSGHDHAHHASLTHSATPIESTAHVNSVELGKVAVAPALSDAKAVVTLQHVAVEPVTTSSLLGAASQLRGACHGTCCFGTSCCVACIVAQATSLTHLRVPYMHLAFADQAVLGFEPASLLEPPNTRA